MFICVCVGGRGTGWDGATFGGELGDTGSFSFYCELGDILTPAGVKALHFMGSYFDRECERTRQSPSQLFEPDGKERACVCVRKCDVHSNTCYV